MSQNSQILLEKSASSFMFASFFGGLRTHRSVSGCSGPGGNRLDQNVNRLDERPVL